MSNSFTSEFMDDDLTSILLELTPDDAEARYTSIEGWSNLTQKG
jgi:hypothetical protein